MKTFPSHISRRDVLFHDTYRDNYTSSSAAGISGARFLLRTFCAEASVLSTLAMTRSQAFGLTKYEKSGHVLEAHCCDISATEAFRRLCLRSKICVPMLGSLSRELPSWVLWCYPDQALTGSQGVMAEPGAGVGTKIPVQPRKLNCPRVRP